MTVTKPDWLAEYEAREQQRRAALPGRKVAVLDALRAASITSVSVEYNGEGDSGQVDYIVARKGDSDVDPATTTLSAGRSLHDEVDDFAWELLDVYHGGFENNDGGQGQITIDVSAGTVTLDHNDRITDLFNTVTEV